MDRGADLWYYRWSSKYGEFPAGDPELHHVAGQLYAEGD